MNPRRTEPPVTVFERWQLRLNDAVSGGCAPCSRQYRPDLRKRTRLSDASRTGRQVVSAQLVPRSVAPRTRHVRGRHVRLLCLRSTWLRFRRRPRRPNHRRGGPSATTTASPASRRSWEWGCRDDTGAAETAQAAGSPGAARCRWPVAVDGRGREPERQGAAATVAAAEAAGAAAARARLALHLPIRRCRPTRSSPAAASSSAPRSGSGELMGRSRETGGGRFEPPPLLRDHMRLDAVLPWTKDKADPRPFQAATRRRRSRGSGSGCGLRACDCAGADRRGYERRQPQHLDLVHCSSCSPEPLNKASWQEGHGAGPSIPAPCGVGQ